MMKTPEEAKLLHCPLAVPPARPSSPCVAEECMAWRWANVGEGSLPRGMHHAIVVTDEGGPEPERPSVVPADWVWTPLVVTARLDDGTPDASHGGYWEETEEGWRARVAAAQAARKGFCGLAGMPVC